MAADVEALEEIHEIGPEVARSIGVFFDREQSQRIIRQIREAGLTLENPYAKGSEGCLDGLTFVFTGALDRWTREEAQRVVEQRGGRATSSVSGATAYVVAGPGAGSKLDEAHARDVPVLDAQAFVDFLEERCGEVWGPDVRQIQRKSNVLSQKPTEVATHPIADRAMGLLYSRYGCKSRSSKEDKSMKYHALRRDDVQGKERRR